MEPIFEPWQQLEKWLYENHPSVYDEWLDVGAFRDFEGTAEDFMQRCYPILWQEYCKEGQDAAIEARLEYEHAVGLVEGKH
jgi:hypothetical protein